jgi:hypothetical protein
MAAHGPWPIRSFHWRPCDADGRPFLLSTALKGCPRILSIITTATYVVVWGNGKGVSSPLPFDTKSEASCGNTEQPVNLGEWHIRLRQLPTDSRCHQVHPIDGKIGNRFKLHGTCNYSIRGHHIPHSAPTQRRSHLLWPGHASGQATENIRIEFN